MSDSVALRFSADASKAKKELSGLGKAFGSVGVDVSALDAKSIAAAAAVAALGVAAFKMGKALVTNAADVARLGDQVAKTARILGVSGEQFQVLAFAADRSGVSMSAVESGLKRLSRNMFDATRGNKQLAQTFVDMGIGIQNADGSLRSADLVLRDIADRVQKVGISSQTTGELMTILGRSGADLANVLVGGSAQLDEFEKRLRAIGGVMSNETLAASEAFEDAMTDLKVAMGGARTEAASPLIPVLTELAKTMVQVVTAMQPVAMVIGEIARFLAGMVLSAAELVGIADKGWVRRAFGPGSREAAVPGAPEDIDTSGFVSGIAAGLLVDTGGSAIMLGQSAGRAAGVAVVDGAVASIEDRHDEFLASMNNLFAVNDAIIDSEVAKATIREDIERQHQATLAGIRDEALAEDRRRADEEREMFARTRDAQAFAANQAFAAVGTFADIAQGAVEDSYLGQTKAGRTAAKALFLVAKGAALAGAVVNTALAVTSALATPPFPVGAALAVGAGIAGAAEIGTIIATSIQGIADAGLAPGALRAAGLNNHTTLAVRNDEAIIDPTGTQEITRMLSMQRRQMEMGAAGGNDGRPIVVVAELDGQRLTRGLSPHMTRALEDGHDYRRNVRVSGAA